MRVVTRNLLFVAALALATNCFAQNIQLEHRTFLDHALDAPESEGPGLWDRFQSTFDRRATDQFTDRFSSLAMIGWNLNSTDEAQRNFRERNADAAFGAFRKSLVNSFREVAFELPGMEWLRERDDALADFFRGSLGNPGEEAVQPLNVTYRAAERSWWDALAEKGGLRYGIRPFRSNPYAFVSFKVNHDNHTLVLGHLRYRFRNFIEHDFEFALSLPIANGLALGFGTSCRFGGDDTERAAGLTIFKSLRNGGLVHIGAEVRRSPGLFAGVALPW